MRTAAVGDAPLEHRITALRAKLTESLDRTPQDVDGREQDWMDLNDLLEERATA